MPSSTSKSSGISLSFLHQLKTKYQIYGPIWTIRLTIQFIFRKVFYEYLQHSFSQYGEDLIISKILRKPKTYFVDIGANHPQKFNNTYHFYLQGGQGINIEPDPVLISQYSQSRSRDTNLNFGASDKSGTQTFYKMYPDVNSTFSHDQYLSNLKRQAILVDTPKVKVTTLADIFDNYLPTDKNIDLLSIDTEGHDYQVLIGNNWQKYQPKVICIEIQTHQLAHDFLIKLGYKLFAKTPINSIYVQESSPVFSVSSSL